jgi:hypothetical protein
MLALVVVLAGLGGYIYFVDSKRPASDIAAKQKVFEGLSADKIEEITLTNDGESSTLKKADGTWKMTAPAAADADQNEASTLTSNLTNLEVNRVVDENASNLTDYGLAKPKITVSFKGQGGLAGELQLGDKTATQGDMYAMKPGTKRVFLISSFQETAFGKKPFDLREKKILNFERDKVDSIEIANASGPSIQLARSGSAWTLKQPVAGRADYSVVEGLLTRLSSANMTKLAEPSATDPAALAKFGLDKPAVTVTLGAGSARATIALGKEEEGATYAKDQSRPLVFTVDQTVAADLKKQADDYRDKELFAFRSFNAARLRIVQGADTYEFQKVAGTGDNPTDKWQRVNAGGAPTDVEISKMEDLLSKLTNLRAQSFAGPSDKTGLDKPELVVAVSFDQGKFERVRAAKPGADAFASRDGEPAVAKLDATAYGDALKALTDLVTPPPSPLK